MKQLAVFEVITCLPVIKLIANGEGQLPVLLKKPLLPYKKLFTTIDNGAAATYCFNVFCSCQSSIDEF